MKDDFTLWECRHVDDPQKEIDGKHTFMEVDEEKIKDFLRGFCRDEGSVDYFYSIGLPVYRERNQWRSHAVVERFLNKYYNVVNLHRDDREDCGDDAGWLAAITESDGKYNLYILFITTNRELLDIVFDEADRMGFHEGDEGGFIDCKTFDTLEEVQAEIDRFMGYLKRIFEEEDADEWYFWDDEYMDMTEELLGVKFDELEKDWIRALTNAYEDTYHDRRNEEAMAKLTTSEYSPNFIDIEEEICND